MGGTFDRKSDRRRTPPGLQQPQRLRQSALGLL